MIKAETINHEGNDAPNWLDQCKAVITPWRSISVLLVLAVVAVALSVHEQQHSQKADRLGGISSQQASTPNSLTVQAANSSAATPQSAVTDTSAAASSTAPVGPNQIPALTSNIVSQANNDSSSQAATTNQITNTTVNNLQSSATGLSNAAESAVQGTTNSLNQLLK